MLSHFSFSSSGPALIAVSEAILNFANTRRAPSQARRLAFVARLTVAGDAPLAWMPTISVAQLLCLIHWYRVVTLVSLPSCFSSQSSFLSAIYDGLCHAERIEKDIDALYNVIVDRMLERNEVLHGLVDGLDAIAVHEGGTAIIDQYAEASELVRSLIVEVGKFSGGSEAE